MTGFGEIVVHSHFAEFTAQVERACIATLEHEGKVVADEARGRAGASGYRIESILGSIKVHPVMRTPQGFEVHVTASDFREIFFELGTLGRRKRPLKRARQLPTRTKAGKLRGIRPGYFMTAGAEAARREIVSYLRTQLP